MTFPRSAAVAELGWSNPGRRQWRDFLRRVSAQFPRYEAMGFPVADSGFAARAVVIPAEAGIQSVELANGFNYGEIRYTLDGTEPTAKSPRYEAPLKIARGVVLRATTFDGERRISNPRTIATDPARASRRASQQLKLCSEHIALSLEDDAPLNGPRAAFLVDIQNPCWIYEGADLANVKGITASVGQVPFNYQIGELVKKITFPKPATPEGELEVRLGCDGDVIARLPLAPAAPHMGVTTLPTASIAPRTGRVNLCMRFSQPALEPFWVLDTIELAR